MLHSYFITTSLALLVVTPFLPGQTCVGDDCLQIQPGVLISEVPQGVIDGSNTIFATKSIPDEQYTIRIARDGVPLTKGKDFQNSENIFVLSTAQTPQRGDTLLVTYVPDKQANTPPALHTGPFVSARNDNLSSAAALQALRSEVKALTSAGEEDVPIRSISQDMSSRSSTGDLLRTLTSRATKQAGFGGTTAVLKKNAVREMEGIDGLGDGEREQRTSNEPHMSAHHVHSMETSSPEIEGSAALRMLEMRLQSAKNAADWTWHPINKNVINGQLGGLGESQ